MFRESGWGGGNSDRYLKSLHSRTMSIPENGMLNNTKSQCSISHLFCIRLYTRQTSVWPTSSHMTSSRSIHFNTCVCWLEISVRPTSRYWHILLHKKTRKKKNKTRENKKEKRKTRIKKNKRMKWKISLIDFCFLDCFNDFKCVCGGVLLNCFFFLVITVRGKKRLQIYY